MGFKSKTSILVLLFFTILSFQNCSQINSPANFKYDPTKINNEANSGTIYEGKVYANVGSLCDDGIEIHSRIVMSSATTAQLNRENCREITPVQLTTADFQINSNTDSLIYKNQNFTYIGFAPAGISNLIATNDNTNFYYGFSYEGDPKFLQIYLDTDNNPATGYARDGIGAEFLIENDNVWIYSAPMGSPQSTWAWSAQVSASPNKVAPNISWSFPKAAIGSPSLIKLIAATSLGFQTPIYTQVPK